VSAAAFTCAVCGAVAGVVRTLPAGEPVRADGPPQLREQQTDGVVVEGFLGTCWRTAGAEDYELVGRLLDAPEPDPRALRRVHPELAPFYCPDCGCSYCAGHWALEVLRDEGFYDCTYGTCPRGHRHKVDD
jgi:hypothetical protein